MYPIGSAPIAFETSPVATERRVHDLIRHVPTNAAAPVMVSSCSSEPLATQIERNQEDTALGLPPRVPSTLLGQLLSTAQAPPTAWMRPQSLRASPPVCAGRRTR